MKLITIIIMSDCGKRYKRTKNTTTIIDVYT